MTPIAISGLILFALVTVAIVARPSLRLACAALNIVAAALLGVALRANAMVATKTASEGRSLCRGLAIQLESFETELSSIPVERASERWQAMRPLLAATHTYCLRENANSCEQGILPSSEKFGRLIP
jgi:hypothetical protein